MRSSQTSATKPVPAVAQGIAIAPQSGPIVFTIATNAVSNAAATPVIISAVRLFNVVVSFI